MSYSKKPMSILLAEDDDDDYLLTAKAFEEAHLLNQLHRVKDGEELMDYLLRRGDYQDAKKAPLPGLILLDLNMPKKDGREALKEIKAHPDLKKIPVVALTTSDAQEDVESSYNLGLNSFIRKPVSFNGLVRVVKLLEEYWFEVVRLPEPG